MWHAREKSKAAARMILRGGYGGASGKAQSSRRRPKSNCEGAVGGIVMAVRCCGLCKYQIRYHGEPEGKYPVEHVFCMLDNRHELEAENMTADRLELEHDDIF